MTIRTTCTQARANFAQLLDEVTQKNDVAIVTRRGAKTVAILPADELTSLLETAHLLRPPKNAERLLTALRRAKIQSPKRSKSSRLVRECAKLDPALEREHAEGRVPY